MLLALIPAWVRHISCEYHCCVLFTVNLIVVFYANLGVSRAANEKMMNFIVENGIQAVKVVEDSTQCLVNSGEV